MLDAVRSMALLVCIVCLIWAQVANGQYYAKPGDTAADIMRARGYLVREHLVKSACGIELILFQGTNPTIANGSLASAAGPILFFAGVMGSAGQFVVNSLNVQGPKDLRHIKLNPNNETEAIELLANEPSIRSLPLLAMNYGHSVWLLERRPVSIYRRNQRVNGTSHVSAATANTVQCGKTAWDFTLDIQAEHDLQNVVDYIIGETNHEKVATVSHSIAGAIQIASLVQHANGRLAKQLAAVVLWSPSFSVGNGPKVNERQAFQPLLELVGAPLPPPYFVPRAQTLLDLMCRLDRSQSSLSCQADNMSNYPAATRELAQQAQAAGYPDGMTRKYNYGPETNSRLYGQKEPPAYDVSSIELKSVFIYSSQVDNVVPPEDSRRLSEKLTVPHKFVLIGHNFGHAGHYTHEKNAELAIIPSYLDIIRVYSG